LGNRIIGEIMTLKYYMRPDSNTPPAYSYCVGEDTDSLWNADTCIEVDPQPSTNHIYDFDEEDWILNEDYYMVDLRAKRDIELTRTDKYVLSDYPIESADLTTVEIYRQELRDCPDKEVFSERVLPDCHDVCKK